ncbi:MAG: ArnT family glycosyltransferase [Phormidesmis sp.]
MLAPKQSVSRDRNYTLTFLAVAILGLLAVGRFFNLSADFPIGLTSYGATYTDEGWWSRNAVALVREGNWFIDDGYNTILNLPTVPLLQALWFKAFGVSQVAARALTATCSVMVSILVYAIARRELKPALAWLAPFIILSSYPVFAFSRIALLEMPMMVLILLSLWLVTSPTMCTQEPLATKSVRTKEGLRSQLSSELMLVVSAVLAVLAILAKTTALFVPPMLLALLVLQPGSPRKKVHQGTIWLLSFLTAYGLYHAFSTQGAVESYSYFSTYNVTAKFHDSLFSAIKGPLRVFKYCAEVFPMLFSALIISVVTLAPHKRYRSSTLFQIVVLWSVLFLGGLSTSNYAAPRYLIVLIVPISLVIPLAIGHFLQRRQLTLFEQINAKPNLKRAAFFMLVPLSVLLSLFRISGYLLAPDYSFVSMAHQVEHTVEAAPDHSPVLMGHFADSLALVTDDIKAINDEMGYQPLSYRIETFNPGYYICVGEMKPPIAETLEDYYSVSLIKTFDVYQNYDFGEPVFFYQLTPKQPLPVGALTSYEKPSP